MTRTPRFDTPFQGNFGYKILSEFTRYSIDFVVWVWIEDPSIAFHSRSKLNMALWSALNKAGVTLA